MKTLLFVFCCLLSVSLNAQPPVRASVDLTHSGNLVIMQPSGQMIDDLPVMRVMPDTLFAYQKVIELVNQSFVGEVLELYFLAQNFLQKKGEIASIEPAYLALSENAGGFAKVGFHLETGGIVSDKSKVHYIDIVEDRVHQSNDRLMSLTQLYPHEMGHLLYGMLNPDKKPHRSKSVDMHYFSVKTDYSTAFNEGFAEHLENVSRSFEPSEDIRRGILKDIERVRLRSEKAINGFRHDLLFPVRIGFYKMTMPIWYQKYENLKRYDHAVQALAKHPGLTLDVSDVEDQLTVRNSGIMINRDELRNYAQILSTEGVISSFFTRLTLGEAKTHYLDRDFYNRFLADTSLLMTESPGEVFSPLQNQMLKYFFIFNRPVPAEASSGSAFVDFFEAYTASFPAEESLLKSVFREVTGLEYSNQVPTPIWLMVRDHDHRMLVPDPYGAITVSVYTFDLNAADSIDLSTLKGIDQEDVQRIIGYREANGFFKDLGQVREIAGVSVETADLLMRSGYDDEYIDSLPKPALSFTALITTPLKHLIVRVLVYFAVIMGMVYLLFIRKEKPSVSRMVSVSGFYLFQWIIFALAGLVLVAVSDHSGMYFFFWVVAVSLLHLLIARKSKTRLIRSLSTTVFMGLIIWLSVI